jgi:hypothetical protein
MKLPRSKHYPKKLRVKDEEYIVRILRRHFDTQRSSGECDDGDKVIRIYGKQSALEIFKTLIHEALHALDAEYNIRLTHKQVYALEEALSDFLIQNF